MDNKHNKLVISILTQYYRLRIRSNIAYAIKNRYFSCKTLLFIPHINTGNHMLTLKLFVTNYYSVHKTIAARQINIYIFKCWRPYSVLLISSYILIYIPILKRWGMKY